MYSRRDLRRGLFGLMIVASACGTPQRPAAPPPAASPAPPTFVNTVWRVSSSTSVEAGGLYVYLSDGTLLISSPHGKPALGSWQRTGDGLTMTEEGIPYRVEVLALDASQFRIRIHNPGPPVEITFVPAGDGASAPAR